VSLVLSLAMIACLFVSVVFVRVPGLHLTGFGVPQFVLLSVPMRLLLAWSGRVLIFYSACWSVMVSLCMNVGLACVLAVWLGLGGASVCSVWISVLLVLVNVWSVVAGVGSAVVFGRSDGGMCMSALVVCGVVMACMIVLACRVVYVGLRNSAKIGPVKTTSSNGLANEKMRDAADFSSRLSTTKRKILRVTFQDDHDVAMIPNCDNQSLSASPANHQRSRVDATVPEVAVDTPVSASEGVLNIESDLVDAVQACDAANRHTALVLAEIGSAEMTEKPLGTVMNEEYVQYGDGIGIAVEIPGSDGPQALDGSAGTGLTSPRVLSPTEGFAFRTRTTRQTVRLNGGMATHDPKHRRTKQSFGTSGQREGATKPRKLVLALPQLAHLGASDTSDGCSVASNSSSVVVTKMFEQHGCTQSESHSEMSFESELREAELATAVIENRRLVSFAVESKEYGSYCRQPADVIRDVVYAGEDAAIQPSKTRQVQNLMASSYPTESRAGAVPSLISLEEMTAQLYDATFVIQPHATPRPLASSHAQRILTATDAQALVVSTILDTEAIFQHKDKSDSYEDHRNK
jgi:hypothetical protein